MATLSEQTNNLYALYERSIVDLAQSIVIKFDQVALATNNLVLSKTGQLTDPTDRYQWKYYQNISGRYNFSDTPMSVYSLDAETSIDFTVASLAANPVTAAAYQYGTPLYNELLAAYPDQETLILGILYPCDIDTAINSPDGTILSYPSYLVESQEIDLIPNLQAWLYAYVNRWVVGGFSLTDELYPAMVLLQTHMNLIGAVVNFRLRKCRTNQAHSFHLKQYLRSHGFIDVYLNEMTPAQALRMYRNIDYYVRNSGFTSTFDELIDILFTQAGMPVYQYVAYQKTEALSRANLSDVAYMQPTALFKRKPINSIAQTFPAPDYDLTQVFEALSDTAHDTALYQYNNEPRIAKQFALSDGSRLLTKVVECAINPVVAPTQVIPDDILFNEWVSMSCLDLYAVPVEYTPVGYIDPVRMTHQQALAMWIYATAMAMKPVTAPADYLPLTRVPAIRANRIAVNPIPSYSTLLGMVDQSVVPASAVEAIYNTAVATPTMVSSLVQFSTFCNNLFKSSFTQQCIYSEVENPIARAQLFLVVEALYEDVSYQLDSLRDPNDSSLGMLYSDLMQQVGLNLSAYAPEDYYHMAIAIYDYATGADSTSMLDPANIQKAMVTLIKYLSSYSITFVSSGETDTTITVGHPMVRAYDVEMGEHEIVNVDEVYCDVLSGELQERIDIYANADATIISRDFYLEEQLDISGPLADFGTDSDYTYVSMVEDNINIGLWATAPDLDPDVLFAQLTAPQRQTLVDIYHRQN